MLQFHERETERKLKKEQEMFNLKQAFMADKNRENAELGKILKQQIEYQSRIKWKNWLQIKSLLFLSWFELFFIFHFLYL